MPSTTQNHPSVTDETFSTEFLKVFDGFSSNINAELFVIELTKISLTNGQKETQALPSSIAFEKLFKHASPSRNFAFKVEWPSIESCGGEVGYFRELANFTSRLYFPELIVFLLRFAHYKLSDDQKIVIEQQHQELHNFLQLGRDVPVVGDLNHQQFSNVFKNIESLKPSDIQLIAQQLLAVLHPNKDPEVVEKELEEQEDQPIAKEQLDPQKLGALVPPKTAEPVADEGGEEPTTTPVPTEPAKTAEPIDVNLKLSDLSFDQHQYVEGFVQLAIRSNLEPIGVDFDSLSPELKQALLSSARGQVLNYILGQNKATLDQLVSGENNIRLKFFRDINHLLMITPGFTHLLQGAVNHRYQQLASEPEKQATFQQQLQQAKENAKANPEASLNYFIQQSGIEQHFAQLASLPGFNSSYRSNLITELFTKLSLDNANPKHRSFVNGIINTLDAMLIEDLLHADSFTALSLLFGANTQQLKAIFGDLVDDNNAEELRFILARYVKLRHIDWTQKYQVLGVNLWQKQEDLNNPQAIQEAEFASYQQRLSETNKLISRVPDQVISTDAGDQLYIAGDYALDYLMGADPHLLGKKDEKAFNSYLQNSWLSRTEQEKINFFLFFDQTATLETTATSTPAGYNLASMLEAQILAQNQLAGEMIFADSMPYEGLLIPGASEGFEQYGLNSAQQVGSAIKNLAGGLFDKAKTEGVKLALDAIAPGSGRILDMLEKIPFFGDLIKKKEKEIADLLLLAVGIPIAMLMLPILLALSGLGKLLPWFTNQVPILLNSTGAGSAVATGARQGAQNVASAGKDLFGSTARSATTTSPLGRSVAQTILSGSGTMSQIATQAVLAPILIVSGATIFTLTVLESAFLVDVPYAPVGQLQAVSQYVDLQKEVKTNCGANCKNWDFSKPGNKSISANYTITITAKNNYTITINDASDVLSTTFNKKRNPTGSVANKTRNASDLFGNQLPIIILPGESHTINYTETFDQNYNHSSVRNTISLRFTYQKADGDEASGLGSEEAKFSQYLCIGDCPLAQNALLALQIIEAFVNCNAVATKTQSPLSAFVDRVIWHNGAKQCLIAGGINNSVVGALEVSADKYKYIQCVGLAVAVSEGKLESVSAAKNYCSKPDLMGATNKNDWTQLAPGDYVISGDGAWGHIAIVHEIVGFQVVLVEADGVSGYVKQRSVNLDVLRKNYCGFLRR